LKTFRSALAHSAFAITAELSATEPAETTDLIRRARVLSGVVDGIQLVSNPPGYAQTSQTALAALLLREGIDVTPTLNCRDRNRIALQSELLGLHAIGVTSLVLNQGGAMPRSPDSPGTAVFDVNCSELISMAHEPDESTFLLGTGASVPNDGSDWNPAPLLERSSAGARFLRLQPCSDIDLLRQHMARLVEDKVTWHYSVMVSLAPLPANVCGPLISDVQSIPGVSGVNLVCRNDPAALIASVDTYHQAI